MGIPVRMHVLTLVLPIGVVAYALWRQLSPASFGWGLLFVLAVLLCVLVHELGHAVAARFFGVTVHDILLLPIGGAARFEGRPKTAVQEALVVFAGPLVNLLLAAACAPWLAAQPDAAFLWRGGYTVSSFLATLAAFNFLVFLVNLVPAFPLDGGRLMRALLAQWTTRLRATKIVAALSRLLVLALVAYTVAKGHYLLVLPLLYLFVVAGREVHVVSVQHFLESQRLGAIALPVRVFDPSTPIRDIIRQLTRNGQRGAVIADECSPIGFVMLDMLTVAERPERHVGDLELLTVVCHDSDTNLRELSHQFACHPHSVAIEEIDGRPAGYVDLELLGNSYEAFAKAGEDQ